MILACRLYQYFITKCHCLDFFVVWLVLVLFLKREHDPEKGTIETCEESQ